MSSKRTHFFGRDPNEADVDCNICFDDKYPLFDKLCNCPANICTKCISNLKQNNCPFCKKRMNDIEFPPILDNNSIDIF